MPKSQGEMPACPACEKADQVIEIMYGKPAPSEIERANKGLVKLGGCMMGPDNKDFYCKRCDKSFNPK